MCMLITYETYANLYVKSCLFVFVLLLCGLYVAMTKMFLPVHNNSNVTCFNFPIHFIVNDGPSLARDIIYLGRTR